jgi:hypothetical protein
MINKNKTSKQKNTYEIQIVSIEKTSDTLSDRADLVLFARYLSKIGIYSKLTKYFGNIRKSKKGIPIENTFKQLFCFLMRWHIAPSNPF